jgi:hypothetical protein
MYFQDWKGIKGQVDQPALGVQVSWIIFWSGNLSPGRTLLLLHRALKALSPLLRINSSNMPNSGSFMYCLQSLQPSLWHVVHGGTFKLTLFLYLLPLYPISRILDQDQQMVTYGPNLTHRLFCTASCLRLVFTFVNDWEISKRNSSRYIKTTVKYLHNILNFSCWLVKSKV